MISARQVFLAIQYLDPEPLPLEAPEMDEEEEMDEQGISDEEVFFAICYLDRDFKSRG